MGTSHFVTTNGQPLVTFLFLTTKVRNSYTLLPKPYILSANNEHLNGLATKIRNIE